MVSARVSLEHGPSRMVWVFRNRGTKALSVGWMTTYDDGGGGGRAGTQAKLLPFRRLMPGRYDIIMARYGVAWPVTLTVDEDAEDPRMMVVSGRVPL